jgi:hypothetical protein
MMHPRTIKNYAPHAYELLVRPGEYKRAQDACKGAPQKPYDIIKKYRSAEYCDFLDTFAFGKEDYKTFWAHPEGFQILFAWDQRCMNHGTNVRFPFMTLCVSKDMQMDRNRIMATRDPMIVRCMGEWDVYHDGIIYETQNAKKALATWIYMVTLKNKQWGDYDLEELLL